MICSLASGVMSAQLLDVLVDFAKGIREVLQIPLSDISVANRRPEHFVVVHSFGHGAEAALVARRALVMWTAERAADFPVKRLLLVHRLKVNRFDVTHAQGDALGFERGGESSTRSEERR